MIRSNIIFKQLFDRVSCTYTYLIGDSLTKKCILIDPVIEHVNRDITLIQQLNLNLNYVANTHVHADHITGSGEIKKLLGSKVKSIISENSSAVADVLVKENDQIKIGSICLQILNTPGHTNGCVTYVDHENKYALTGDALLIRGCGRTDFQEGSSSLLYDSVWNKIFSLPKNFLLFPAHDYNGFSVSSVEEEIKYNPRFTKNKSDFIDLMKNLKLEKPKMIDIAVPKNMVCGI